MCVNWGKTKFMVFQPKGQSKIYFSFKVGEARLEQVSTQRCLGVMVDDELKFSDHVEMISASALKAINKQRYTLNNANTEVAIVMYKSKVRSIMESTYPLWCCVNDKHMKKIERVQRIALLQISGAMNSTPTPMLEHILQIEPIKIRLEEVLMMFYAKIQQYEDSHYLKEMINHGIAQGHNKKTSQCEIIRRKLKDYPETISKAPKINIKMTEVDIQSSPEIYISNNKFGSAGNRTQEQMKKGLEDAKRRIEEVPAGQPIIFTDGSALGNPGPCGASAVMFREGVQSIPIVENQAVSSYSTSYRGELVGLQIATKMMLEEKNKSDFNSINIFCDCESAINSTQNIADYKTPDSLKQIRENTKKLQEMGIKVKISHVPGHVNLMPNELADKKAKEAAVKAKTMNNKEIDLKLIKQVIRKITTKKWENIGTTLQAIQQDIN